MPTPDPLLRYATDSFPANGVTTDWEISFVGGYIDPEHVYAMSVVLDTETGLATDRTSHPVQIISESEDSSIARVTPAVAAGRTLYIYRSTPLQQMLVNYVAGSLISKKNLNLSNDQLLKIIQEMVDNLNITALTVDQQLGTIIDLEQLIQEIYQTVLELLEAGGIIGVEPKVWTGSWTGDNEGVTDFPIAGADVEQAAFYDVYVDQLGMVPEGDYTIIIDEDDPANSAIRFAEPAPNGSVWFAVLRGFAKPYSGPPPISLSSLRVPIITASGLVYFASNESEYALVNLTEAAGCEVTLREIPAMGATRLGDGSYMSFMQGGGAVTVIGDAGVIINVPAGCLPATRGQYSVITATCLSADTNTWVLSGDLAKEA